MAFSERSLDDYIDVAQRIADFREQYPTGSLQPADPGKPWELATVTGYDKSGEQVAQTFVVYVAAAYRTPDDPRPGIGAAWEVWPGRTNFTRGSELQNAETSAWGRAIVAVLASDTKQGVASRQEVAARRAEREPDPCRCGHLKSHHIPDTQPPGCNECDCTLMWNADGSLSRSRTTDAEKDAAGVMTSAQQAEHTALQPKRSEVLRERLTRTGAVHTPLDDPWLDQPAGQLPQETEREPGSLTPQQQRAIHAACKGMERPERLATISDIVGRQVTSSNELSYTEAAKVLEKLSGVQA